MLKFTRKIKNSQGESTTTKFSITTSFVVQGLAAFGTFLVIVMQYWPF